jgi:transcriptional regulator with XRE-family HTH domain/tetratricopeptide (TPR) repeat protein
VTTSTSETGNFGALLRQHRLAASLSQEQLGERAQLSVDAVAALERGRRTAPRPGTVVLLADALSLTPAERRALIGAATAAKPGGPAKPDDLSHPLATLSSPPAPLTSFGGRDRELTEVQQLLGTTRLLTLIGSRGVGKTRLALRIASEVAHNYADGIWLVDLAPLADATLVSKAVASALDVQEQPRRPLVDTLADALRGRALLLLLDNCEHLLDACARLVDALLSACPDVRVLATSRERLGITGEIAWRVPSLLVPDPQHRRVAPHRGSETGVAERAQAAAVFVGREREMKELLAGLDDAMSRRGRLYLLSGEPGIGKSRLAHETAMRARECGVRVAWGRCWEAGGAPAFWPWVQSLRSYIRDADPRVLQSHLGSGTPFVAQILPELAEALPDVLAPPTLAPDAARFQLFDAVARFLRNTTADQPLMLVLDDLHAADRPSLLLLQFVAREIPDMRMFVVGTYRDFELERDHPLALTIAELAREQATRQLPLVGLAEADVAMLIQGTAGITPHERLVQAIQRETDGNPLFVSELVRLLAAEGKLADNQDPRSIHLTIPAGIRDAIGRRLQRLSAEGIWILKLASVFGRDFRLDALERLGGRSTEQLLSVLEEAEAARVVVGIPGIPVRMRFGHALIRDVLYAEIPTGQRLRLHRQAGEALEALHAGRTEQHLAELAHHFFEAAPGGEAARAVEYAHRAGDQAAAQLAYEEAVRLYRMALTVLDASMAQDEPRRCELLLALGDALSRAGERLEAKESFLTAARIAEVSDMPEQLARAALGYGGPLSIARGASDPHLLALLEAARGPLGDIETEVRVRVMARMAAAMRDQPDRGPRIALSNEAVAIARRLGHPRTLAYALSARSAAIMGPDLVEEQLALADEFQSVAEQAQDMERVAEAHLARTPLLLELGNVGGLRSEVQAMQRLARELRQPVLEWLAAALEAMLCLTEGALDQSERRAAEAFRLGERSMPWDAAAFFHVQTFAIRREQGRLGEMVAVVRRSAEEYSTRPLFRCLLLVLYCELGQLDNGRLVLEELAHSCFSALPVNNDWLHSVCLLSEAATALGDSARAGVLYDLLRPYDWAVTDDVQVCLGSVARFLGLLAATLSRWDEAVVHFERALEKNRQMGGRLWTAHTESAFARMLVQRHGPGDREHATLLLRSALTASRELGIGTLEKKAAAELHELGE